jgi:hypothetical protein
LFSCVPHHLAKNVKVIATTEGAYTEKGGIEWREKKKPARELTRKKRRGRIVAALDQAAYFTAVLVLKLFSGGLVWPASDG